MRRTVSTCWALLLLCVSVCGCRGEKGILLFGAASVTNALDEIKDQFQRESGVKVNTSYAASSVLAQQIVNGAQADVFVSANVDWANYVDENGMVQQRQDLLVNLLVIVVPADSQLEIHGPEDLLGAEIKHLALAETASVPAGIYAKKALSELGLWDQLKQKVVPGSDVRQTLAYVATGAAQAGIVYLTDAAITQAVKIAAEIPADLTEPIRYPVVLLKHGSGNQAAESFYRYLCSPRAAEVFKRHGFIVPIAPVAAGQ